VTVGTRQARASKTGYLTSAVSTIGVTDSTATYTQNLFLVSSSIRATVSGTVTDSAGGTPLAGAKILLRIGTGAYGAARDSVVTGASGTFSFDTVPAGSFTLATSDSGYNSKNVTGNITNATPPAVSIQLVKITYGSITGTVTDSVAGTAVAGAKVYLRTTGGGGGGGGGTILDSATTATDGSYTIANVQSGIARTLRAQDSGYVTKNTTVTVVGTAALTANIQLVKILYGSITGTVTDSAAGTGIAGAKVYLRATGGGGGGTILDSATTATDGSYTVANVQSGIARSLSAQATGYTTKTSTVTVVGTAALTANFQLIAIVYGSITGTVTDSAAGTGISGVKVYLRATGGGGTLLDSATTATDGSYTIAHVQSAMARSLSAQATGYTTKTSTVTVVGTGALTVNFQLIAIVYGSITGTVTDSVAATGISGAKVYLRTTGGAGTILDSATTATDGSYTISHVQSGIARTLRAQATGYVTKNATVTVVGTAALTVNFALRTGTAVKPSLSAQGNSKTPDFGISQAGFIRLSNFNEAGTIMVFDLNGRLLYRSAMQAHTTSLSLPVQFAKSGNSYIVSISQNNTLYRKQIMMP